MKQGIIYHMAPPILMPRDRPRSAHDGVLAALHIPPPGGGGGVGRRLVKQSKAQPTLPRHVHITRLNSNGAPSDPPPPPTGLMSCILSSSKETNPSLGGLHPHKYEWLVKSHAPGVHHSADAHAEWHAAP